MKMKKVLAVVMSLCMTAGVVSYGAPVISQSITAQAEAAEEDGYSFDAETGVLTLMGEVDCHTLSGFMSYKRNDVKSVIAEEGTVFLEDCNMMFCSYKNCTSIDLSKADTSRVTDMRYMFEDCENLTELDISSFDTSSVTNMGSMFNRCKNLTELDLSGFDTSSVTNMSSMFEDCKCLTALDISSFDTSNVTNMSYMFDGCESLTELDLSGFDTISVTNMSFIFSNCKKFTSLDLSRFDTSKVTNMSGMFWGCEKLPSLDVSGFDTSNVTNMSSMFDYCKRLTALDVSGFDTSNVTDMRGMFYGCFKLSELDVSGFNTSKVTDMSLMFDLCGSLHSIDVSGFDTSSTKEMGFMFKGCSSLTSLDVSGFDTRNVSDMRHMFEGCFVLTSLDVSGFDTSKVTDMAGMFENCCELTSLDVSGFDTSNLTDMSGLFENCYALTSLDVSGFDTSNVKYMGLMFFGCKKIKEFDLSGFDTSNVISMDSMFTWCEALTSLDLSGFDTSKVTSMCDMFRGCSTLTALDLSGFDTSSVSYMFGMFQECSAITSLDLSSFDTSRVSSMTDMFYKCDSLNTIVLGENFGIIKEEAKLLNSHFWANADAPGTVVGGGGEYAVIKNKGKNTYIHSTVAKPSYPTYINVEYNEQYRQVRLKWGKVIGADRYGIAVYLAGKWRVQNQNITGTVYTSPKNLTPGMTYKVAIAARVNGKWDTANAIKNAVTVTVRGNSYVKPDIEINYGWDLYVIADEITMYLGPDTSYGKVTTIPRKTFLDELGIMNDNDNWAFTKYNGQYGWVQMVNDKDIMEVQIWGPVAAKPVIYLYPEKETDVHVEVELTEADLATTYPKYNNGWDVVAKPDGSLVNKADGTHHRYLFWDAVNCRTEFDLSKGFCVAGSDTESFLKEKLSYMGLTEDEMNEFIVYWLPKMEHNKYNLISFQSEKYTDSAKLNITPAPDSMLRVFMTYVPLEKAVDIEPQELSTFERNGFTVVEWGGSEL